MAVGDIRNYNRISWILLASFVIELLGLVVLTSGWGSRWILSFTGPKAAFLVQLFFWGAVGASIASSLFLARDKEDNEIESLKPTPDPSKLRYPTDVDVHLYVHRVLTSAALAVVGALFLYAGLSFFDVPQDVSNPKHLAFFILFAFLVGFYQGNFVSFLSERFRKMLERSG